MIDILISLNYISITIFFFQFLDCIEEKEGIWFLNDFSNFLTDGTLSSEMKRKGVYCLTKYLFLHSNQFIFGTQVIYSENYKTLSTIHLSTTDSQKQKFNKLFNKSNIEICDVVEKILHLFCNFMICEEGHTYVSMEYGCLIICLLNACSVCSFKTSTHFNSDYVYVCMNEAVSDSLLSGKLRSMQQELMQNKHLIKQNLPPFKCLKLNVLMNVSFLIRRKILDTIITVVPKFNWCLFLQQCCKNYKVSSLGCFYNVNLSPYFVHSVLKTIRKVWNISVILPIIHETNNNKKNQIADSIITALNIGDVERSVQFYIYFLSSGKEFVEIYTIECIRMKHVGYKGKYFWEVF